MRYQSELIQNNSIRHGFFDNTGGVSTGVYTSLNCGPGSADNPAYITENRRRVLQQLELPAAHLLTLHQIHSPQALTIITPWELADRPQADAMVTTHKNLALGILTADCCPILFADAQHGVIGAAHAGWRGAFGGVVENTLTAMRGLGATPATIIAAIGPTIQQANYEVDNDFRIRFMAIDSNNKTFFAVSNKTDHYLFNLPAYVRHRLAKAGIKTIDDCALDTYPPDNNFFSFRRRCHEEPSNPQPEYGRQISVICLS